jgi:hypothetical protein
MRTFWLVLAFLLLIAFLPTHAEAGPYGYMQILQNDLADRYRLPRFKNLDQLKAFIKAGMLVKVVNTDAYILDPTFGEKDPDHRELYAHVQPWTKAFLDRELGTAHEKFGTRYVITSLVRTQKYQDLLCGLHGRRNVNAICGGHGWKRSAHLTGAVVDIGRLGLTAEEQTWMRRRLNVLRSHGKLVYIPEGGQQYCFHIMVLPSYDREAVSKQAKRRHQKVTSHPKHQKTRH